MKYSVYDSREVVVVGNGVSRKNQDLAAWKFRCGVMIGCNYLYKEILPDILVSADWKLTARILKDIPAYPGMHVFRDRSVWKVRVGRMILVSLMKPGWSSGGRAVELACSLCDPEKVHIIGFDLDWTPNGSYNNIYAGEPEYKKEGDPPTSPSNFINQLKSTVVKYPTVQFVRYVPCKEAVNKELDLFPNVAHEIYS